jgi:hypothetical protein
VARGATGRKLFLSEDLQTQMTEMKKNSFSATSATLATFSEKAILNNHLWTWRNSGSKWRIKLSWKLVIY